MTGLTSGCPGASSKGTGKVYTKLFDAGLIEEGDCIYVNVLFGIEISGMWGVIHKTSTRHNLIIRHSPFVRTLTNVRSVDIVDFILSTPQVYTSDTKRKEFIA